MRNPLCTVASIFLLLLAGGCTSYRYDVSPESADASMDASALEVLKDRDLVIPAAPARLRLRQVESRCVVLIENPTDAEINLESSGSAVVDPLGQSRGIAGQLIPPGAFVKLILPPLRDAPPAGPLFQFGVGMQVRSDEPRPVQYLDVGRSQDYWEWDGNGPVRLVLTLRQKNETFRHAFVLRRTKR